MKQPKTEITTDQLSLMNIAFMAITIQEILGQYNTQWMPKKLKKQYTQLAKLAEQMEMEADKQANVHYTF